MKYEEAFMEILQHPEEEVIRTSLGDGLIDNNKDDSDDGGDFWN